MIKSDIQKLSVNSVKHRHKELVLRALLQDRATTRTKIASELKISNTTVGTIMDEFLAEGIISEEKDNSTAMGRRPNIVKIEADKILTMLIDLRKEGVLSYTIMNILGTIVYQEKLTASVSYISSFESLLESAQNKLGEDERTTLLSGICVCIPGVYIKSTDSVVSCHIAELCDIHILSVIKGYFDAKVFVENDINLATNSYIAMDKMQYRNALFLYIGEGIGSSLILDGKLYMGSCGYAGEIGQTFINDAVTLEEKASSKIFFSKIKNKYKAENTQEIKDIARRSYYSDESYICMLISEVIDALAFSLTNIILINNPEKIYICGDFNFMGAKFIDALREKIYSRIPDTLAENTSIEYADDGEFNIPAGANYILINDWVKRTSRKAKNSQI